MERQEIALLSQQTADVITPTEESTTKISMLSVANFVGYCETSIS